MAFTRKMIKDAAKDCGIDDLPREFIDALMDSHVEARDVYAEAQVEAARKAQTDTVDVKESEEYKALEKEYNDYKTAQEGKETQAAKEAAARAFFESRSIKDANLKIAMRSAAAEISALELDKDGKIKNDKTLDELVKGDLSGLVHTTTVTGASTATPPASSGTGMTKESIMAIKDRGERRKAIAENMHLFGQNQAE